MYLLLAADLFCRDEELLDSTDLEDAFGLDVGLFETPVVDPLEELLFCLTVDDLSDLSFLVVFGFEDTSVFLFTEGELEVDLLD